jgi:hypothetical protein
MVSESNFVVRVSGRMENSYYIDYLGAYKVMDIAKIAGVEPAVIKEIYLANGAEHDGRLDVFYFGNMENAKKAVSEILRKAGTHCRGRFVFLTEAEIEFIRKALINEGANTLRVKNNIKDEIFRKLNS